VVTKDDLFQTVWPGTVVSDDALTSCIQELRRALRDTAARPRYLETAYRRGFRFIGKVVSRQQAGASSQEETRGRGRVTSPTSPQASSLKPLAPTLVGRERELEQLNGWLETALAGERQLVFVTGEPGIGKTTLVETFLRSLESKVQRLESREERQNSKGNRQKAKSKVASPSPSLQPPTPVFIGREQCIEHHGAGEGYLPVLEALGRLCREAESPLVIEVLRQQAPTWLGSF
jgi:hypothetical protein